MQEIHDGRIRLGSEVRNRKITGSAAQAVLKAGLTQHEMVLMTANVVLCGL